MKDKPRNKNHHLQKKSLDDIKKELSGSEQDGLRQV